MQLKGIFDFLFFLYLNFSPVSKIKKCYFQFSSYKIIDINECEQDNKHLKELEVKWVHKFNF